MPADESKKGSDSAASAEVILTGETIPSKPTASAPKAPVSVMKAEEADHATAVRNRVNTVRSAQDVAEAVERAWRSGQGG